MTAKPASTFARRALAAWLAGSLLAFGSASAQVDEFQSSEIQTSQAGISDAKARVDAAKADGQVGEQWDGYLGLVHGNVETDLKAAVDTINWARFQLYRQAAERSKVTAEVAGVSAFKAVIEAKIPPGEIYRNDQGAWVRKPDPAAGKKGKKK